MPHSQHRRWVANERPILLFRAFVPGVGWTWLGMVGMSREAFKQVAIGGFTAEEAKAAILSLRAKGRLSPR